MRYFYTFRDTYASYLEKNKEDDAVAELGNMSDAEICDIACMLATNYIYDKEKAPCSLGGVSGLISKESEVIISNE